MNKFKMFVLCAAALAGTGCGNGAAAGQTLGQMAEDTSALGRLRRATRAFQSIDDAVAAGYAATVAKCIAHAQHGAMGFHHTNRALLDGKLEVARPEILIYERMADGGYVLNGVEYIVPYSVLPRDAEPPMILGQKLKRADGLELWYLHVWIWKDNTKGLFADWNPDVECRS
jgi:hypothetical protein